MEGKKDTMNERNELNRIYLWKHKGVKTLGEKEGNTERESELKGERIPACLPLEISW